MVPVQVERDLASLSWSALPLTELDLIRERRRSELISQLHRHCSEACEEHIESGRGTWPECFSAGPPGRTCRRRPRRLRSHKRSRVKAPDETARRPLELLPGSASAGMVITGKRRTVAALRRWWCGSRADSDRT